MRIRHHIVARAFNDKPSVSLFDEGHVRKEVHEALKDKTTILPLIECMGKQGDVLMPDAALEIGIAHLMSLTQIAKGDTIVMLLLNLVVYLPAIHLADGDIYPSATEIGQQRMVAQWSQLHIVHFGCRVCLGCDGGLYRLIHSGDILGRKVGKGIGNGMFVIHALYQLHKVAALLNGVAVFSLKAVSFDLWVILRGVIG